VKTVNLIRTSLDDKQTLGVLVVNPNLFICKTLELAWDYNKSNISCIPPGMYLCKWTLSPSMSEKRGHSVYTYEVLGVPKRYGIRIHSANYFYDLLGCIALGDAYKDLNLDGKLDLIHSGNTVKKFNELMNKEDFRLSISVA